MTWTESCEWFPGGFALVCHSDMKGPMGDVKGLGILGYNAEEKVYTYYGVDSMGFGDYAKGTVQGDIWTYTSEGKMGGKTVKSRFVLNRVSPATQKFTGEMSEDGGSTWKTMMTGESSKAK